MQISKNFNVEEFERSETAIKKGIDNRIPDDALLNIVALVENVLQPLRDVIGPIHINSGYRCPELNKAIGGVPTSQHQKGEAADIRSDKFSAREICDAVINSDIPFDQLIFERKGSTEWVHVSYKRLGQNKQKAFDIIK